MPPFLKFLQTRLENVLSRLKLNTDTLFVEDLVAGAVDSTNEGEEEEVK